MSTSEPSIKELLASAGIVFTGAVTGVGNSPMADLAPDEHTVVVQVEQVLHSPPGLPVPPGSTVTVQTSQDLPVPAPGERLTFFANGLVYGDDLAVTEVGRVPAEQAAERTHRLPGVSAPVTPVRAALAELAQDEVADHVRDADLVVRAHVTQLAQAPESARTPREHDPHWWLATLHIESVERGELAGGESTSATDSGGTESSSVVVLYANSIDVRWRDSPKPKAGQSGLWLLHRTTGDHTALAPFELLHQIDLQPSVQVDLLRERGL